MRFHQRTLNIKWKKGVKRPEKSNAIDMLCSGQVPPHSKFEVEDYERNFEEVPQPFSREERASWLDRLSEVAVSSDAFVSSTRIAIVCAGCIGCVDWGEMYVLTYTGSSHLLITYIVRRGVESSISRVRQGARMTMRCLRPRRSWALPLLSRVQGCSIIRSVMEH